MTKYTCFAFMLLLGITSATLTLDTQLSDQVAMSKCGSYQCSTPSGCWNSCSDPKYNSCGDMFPALYNPSFCAYTKDGRYVNYTYECQACKNTDVIAVRNGACSCDFLKCGLNQICQNGQCVDRHPIDPINLCLTVKCSAGFTCQNGKCVADVTPCKKLCMVGYVCVNDQCIPSVPVDKCATIRCMNGYICQDGNCILVDKCASVVCSPGSACKNGICINYVTPIDPCSVIKCFPGTECKDGKCVQIIPFDPCMLMKCAAGFVCQNGGCVAVDSCAAIRCREGYFCDNGQCVDKCALVRCRQGYDCKQGQCIAQPGLCGVVVCATGLDCINGQCVDRCAAIRCAAGYYCQNGQCIPNQQPVCDAKRIPCTYPRPDQVSCPTKYYFVAPTPNYCGITATGDQIGFPEECDACKDKSVQYYWTKRCQDIAPCVHQPECSCDDHCQSGLSCEAQSCVNKCLNVKCYAGSHCVKGTCVPDVGPVDNCAAVTCLIGTYCVNGKCVPLYPTSQIDQV